MFKCAPLLAGAEICLLSRVPAFKAPKAFLTAGLWQLWNSSCVKSLYLTKETLCYLVGSDYGEDQFDQHSTDSIMAASPTSYALERKHIHYQLYLVCV